MTKSIKEAFKEHVNYLYWLDDETRKIIKEKVDGMDGVRGERTLDPRADPNWTCTNLDKHSNGKNNYFVKTKKKNMSACRI